VADPSAERWVYQVLDAAGSGIVILDRSGSVIFANARAKSLAAAAGVASAEQFLDPTIPRQGFVAERRTLDGTDGFEVVLLSSTDAGTRVEAALARVARLEDALRELSVASHKINNPITALLGRAQMLRGKSHADPLVEKSLHVIDESATRVAELAKEISKLLKDARREPVETPISAERLEPVGSSSGR